MCRAFLALIPVLFAFCGGAPVAAGEDTGLRVRVVTADERPIPDARVLVRRDEVATQRQTDATGMAHFPLGPGTYTVTVMATGFVGEERDAVEIEDGAEELRFELDTGVSFRGRLLDPAGSPVADADLVVVEGGLVGDCASYSGDPDVLARVRTDEAGHFAVGGVPLYGCVTVVAALEGYATERVSVKPDLEQRLDDLVIVSLRPGAVVEGTVLAPNGAPVSGARVYVVPAEVPELHAYPRSYAFGADGIIWRAESGVTDERGHFRVTRLRRDVSYVALGEADGLGDSEPSVPFTLPKGEHEGDIGILLRKLGVLVLHVLDADGKPPARVRLEVSGRYQATPPAIDGLYRFEGLQPGLTRVRVEEEDHLQWFARPTVLPGEEVRLDAQLDRGASMAGVLRGPDGEPVADMRVAVEIELSDSATGYYTRYSRDDRTDQEGRFSITALPPGAYTPRVWSTTFELCDVQEITVPAADVELCGVWLGRATLRVVKPDGTPLEGTLWYWRPTEYAGSRVTSHDELKDGRLTIENLHEEPEEILFVPDGFVAFRRSVSAAPGETLDLGTHVLDPGVALRGQILAPDGQPAAGASVSVLNAGGVADEEGRFELTPVPRGRVHVDVKLDGQPRNWFSVEVSDPPQPVTLRMQTGARVCIRLRLHDGKPGANQGLGVERKVDDRWEDLGGGRTGREGEMRGWMVPGRLRLHWSPDGKRARGRVLGEYVIPADAADEVVIEIVLPQENAADK